MTIPEISIVLSFLLNVALLLQLRRSHKHFDALVEEHKAHRRTIQQLHNLEMYWKNQQILEANKKQ